MGKKNRIAIVTDTNSGISPEEAQKLGVHVVPMPFLIDDEEFFENINLSQTEFYEKLEAGSNVSTSQPSANSVAEMWEQLLKTHSEIVYIPMSGGLSASVENAKHISKQFENRVFVVDNHRISVTQKSSVIDAVKMANDGKTAKEIQTWLEKTGSQSSIYIMLTTLKYLKKGGRITPAAAALGSLLKIKPILTIQGEKLDKFAQVISYQQGKKKMLDQMVRELETRFKQPLINGKLKIFIAYSKVQDKALEFENEANAVLSKYELKIEYVDPLSLSVSCHIGDGAIAIAYSVAY